MRFVLPLLLLIPGLLLANPVLNITSITHPACSNTSDGQVVLSASGGTAPYTYSVDGGAFQASATFAGLAAGPHTFTVKDATNTIATVNATLTGQQTAPSAAFTAADSVCQGAATTLTYTGGAGSGGVYLWSFDGGTTAGTLANQAGPHTLTWSLPGTKTVTLTVAVGVCQSTVTHLVTIRNLPSPVIAPEPNQCQTGNNFTFNCTPANLTGYSWNFGAGATPATGTSAAPPAVTYGAAGTRNVSVQVVDKHGCTASTNLSVTTDAAPVSTFTINGGSGSLCAGSQLSFTYTGGTVSPNQTYFWSFSTGAPATSTLKNPTNIAFTQSGLATIVLEVTNGACTVSSSQSVNILAPLVGDAGQPKSYCEGSGGVALQGSANGGQSPYSYTWTCSLPAAQWGISNPFAAAPTVNPTLAPSASGPGKAQYYLVVTDANGCTSAKDSVEVSVLARPKLRAGGDRLICGDAPGQFLNGGVAANNIAPGPIQYQWTPALGLSNANVATPFADPSITTIYTITGTSSNGCSSISNTLDTTTNVTVQVSPNPVVSAGPNRDVCPGGSAQLAGATSGGTAPITFAWTPNIGLNSATILTPTVTPPFTTIYTLTVNAGGCIVSDTVEVKVTPIPTLNITGPADVCFGDTATLSALASVPNCSFFWVGNGLNSNTVQQPLASPFATTTYSVKAVSPAGCQSATQTHTLTVKPSPVAGILQKDTSICAGNSLVLNGSVKWLPSFPVGGTYSIQWAPAHSIVTDPTKNVVTVKPFLTTTYFIEAKSGVNAECTWRDSVTVSVVQFPKLALLPADTTICTSDTLLLRVTGSLSGAKYTWKPANQIISTNAVGDSVRVVAPANTTFKAIVTIGGCSDSAAAVIKTKPGPTATYLTSVERGCRTLSLTATPTAKDAVAYVWTFGDGTPNSNLAQVSHTYTQPGNYFLNLMTIGAGGCRTKGIPTPVQVDPGPQVQILASQAAGTPLPLDSALVQFTDQSLGKIAAWQWDFGDGSIGDSSAQWHQYRDPGSFMVSLTVTDSLGCRATGSYGPIVIDGKKIFIPNVLTPNGDGKNDAFAPEYLGAGQVLLVITDRWGKEVFRQQAMQAAWDGNVKGVPAPAGVYFYFFEAGGQIFRGDLTLIR